MLVCQMNTGRWTKILRPPHNISNLPHNLLIIFNAAKKKKIILVQRFYFGEWYSDKNWILLYETIQSLQKCHLLFFRDPRLRSNYDTKSSKDTKITQIIGLPRCYYCIDGVTQCVLLLTVLTLIQIQICNQLNMFAI